MDSERVLHSEERIRASVRELRLPFLMSEQGLLRAERAGKALDVESDDELRTQSEEKTGPTKITILGTTTGDYYILKNRLLS